MTFFSPITQKRLTRFRRMRLARISFWLLAALYGVSLVSELVANSNPLYVRFENKSFFPVLFFYPEDAFLKNGKNTRPDYKEILKDPAFSASKKNFMLFAPVPYGPFESIDPKSLPVPDEVEVSFTPAPRMATIHVDTNLQITRSVSAGSFFNTEDATGLFLHHYFQVPANLKQALALRFANQDAPQAQGLLKIQGHPDVMASLSTYEKRSRPPLSVRLTLSEPSDRRARAFSLALDRSLKVVKGDSQNLDAFDPDSKNQIRELARQSFTQHMEPVSLRLNGVDYRAAFEKTEIRFPYPPVSGHWMGLDTSGRDVFARILYGLRTSFTFGIILVVCSMVLGTVAGAVQGFYGGILDITAQRLIEIWSALPFLYVMILLGSIYGRSFVLLLVCYGIFNWIGISYYMRGEFLRLRKQAFVEAAVCLGLPARKVLFKHILPNALVPIITFFPFSLVGAIGSLAALDYLGFGLPPPTPSWGELLSQAQQFRWAWWLILYPSLALFLVMLLGVFVGEGVRNAFDPKPYSRLR